MIEGRLCYTSRAVFSMDAAQCLFVRTVGRGSFVHVEFIALYMLRLRTLQSVPWLRCFVSRSRSN